MEYANHLKEYAPAPSEARVAEEVARMREIAVRNHNKEVYKFCYSAIDLTTLSCNDSVESVTESPRRPGLPFTAPPCGSRAWQAVSLRHRRSSR